MGSETGDEVPLSSEDVLRAEEVLRMVIDRGLITRPMDHLVHAGFTTARAEWALNKLAEIEKIEDRVGSRRFFIVRWRNAINVREALGMPSKVRPPTVVVEVPGFKPVPTFKPVPLPKPDPMKPRPVRRPGRPKKVAPFGSNGDGLDTVIVEIAEASAPSIEPAMTPSTPTPQQEAIPVEPPQAPSSVPKPVEVLDELERLLQRADRRWQQLRTDPDAQDPTVQRALGEQRALMVQMGHLIERLRTLITLDI